MGETTEALAIEMRRFRNDFDSYCQSTDRRLDTIEDSTTRLAENTEELRLGQEQLVREQKEMKEDLGKRLDKLMQSYSPFPSFYTGCVYFVILFGMGVLLWVFVHISNRLSVLFEP